MFRIIGFILFLLIFTSCENEQINDKIIQDNFSKDWNDSLHSQLNFLITDNQLNIDEEKVRELHSQIDLNSNCNNNFIKKLLEYFNQYNINIKRIIIEEIHMAGNQSIIYNAYFDHKILHMEFDNNCNLNKITLDNNLLEDDKLLNSMRSLITLHDYQINEINYYDFTSQTLIDSNGIKINALGIVQR